MFCKWCNELIPEDNVCDNKMCIYLTRKLKEYGVFQFYIRTFGVLEQTC